MNIGGIVIEARPRKHPEGDDIVVTVVDPNESGSRKQFTSVTVEPTEEAGQIKIGDSLWWQGNLCFWTPKHRNTRGEKSDIEIPRAGYSREYQPREIEDFRKRLEEFASEQPFGKAEAVPEIQRLLDKLVGHGWECKVYDRCPGPGQPKPSLEITICQTEGE